MTYILWYVHISNFESVATWTTPPGCAPSDKLPAALPYYYYYLNQKEKKNIGIGSYVEKIMYWSERKDTEKDTEKQKDTEM